MSGRPDHFRCASATGRSADGRGWGQGGPLAGAGEQLVDDQEGFSGGIRQEGGGFGEGEAPGGGEFVQENGGEHGAGVGEGHDAAEFGDKDLGLVAEALEEGGVVLASGAAVDVDPVEQTGEGLGR